MTPKLDASQFVPPNSSNPSKESIYLAFTVCIASAVLYMSKPSRAIAFVPSQVSRTSASSRQNKGSTASSSRMSTLSAPHLVDPSDIFSKEESEALIVCWNEDRPRGRFLRERHGYTHFQIVPGQHQHDISSSDESPPNDSGNSKGLVVVCHGLGVSYYAFDKFTESLAKAGYTVLQYDYYGHGYSKYDGDMFVEYDKEMLVDQLEDVLGFVESEIGETCVAMVGHSTGGIVCTAANDRWSRKEEGSCRKKIVPKLILAAPAFFAKKPFMARVADKIPDALTSVMKHVPVARVIIGDSYMEAGDIAFAHDPVTGKTIYATEEKAKKDHDKILFGRVKGKKKHPFLEGGILGINCHTLRGDLLQGHRNMLLNVLEQKGDCKSRILWIWGNLDKTVPYEENISLVKKWEEELDNFQVVVQDRLGHEMFYEDSNTIASVTMGFLES